MVVLILSASQIILRLCSVPSSIFPSADELRHDMTGSTSYALRMPYHFLRAMLSMPYHVSDTQPPRVHLRGRANGIVRRNVFLFADFWR